MHQAIRAMSFGEMLDTGFRILRDRFGLMLALTAVGYLPLGLLMSAAAGPGQALPGPGRVLVSVGAVLVYSLLALPVVMAATIHVAGSWLLGRETTLRASLALGLSIYLPMVGTFFLLYLVLLGLGGAVLVAAATGMLAPVLGVVLGLLAAGGAVWVFVGLLIVPQLVVLERGFGLHPLRRSWELLQGHRLRALGVLGVVGVVTMVLQGALVLPTLPFPRLSPIAQYLGQGLGQALSMAVTCAFYVDLRCRREGFDLEHLAAQVAGRDDGAGRRDPVAGPSGDGSGRSVV